MLNQVQTANIRNEAVMLLADMVDGCLEITRPKGCVIANIIPHLTKKGYDRDKCIATLSPQVLEATRKFTGVADKVTNPVEYVYFLRAPELLEKEINLAAAALFHWNRSNDILWSNLQLRLRTEYAEAILNEIEKVL